jgi:antitoxin component YwqK of YwqJK toxin-antitoxin module
MFRISVIITVAVIIFSCSTAEKKKNGSVENGKTSSAGKHELTAKGKKLEFDTKTHVVKKYDINKDQKPDIINVFKKIPIEGKRGEYDQKIHVKMMDLNRDTKIDVWRFFDDNGAVIKEELDLDFDGKIDATDHYLNGIVRRREVDFQFDEETDIWKHFDEKGALMLIEADQSGDGKIDYWEHYTNGTIERIEKDTDGDSKPDIFKRSGDADFTRILSTTDKFEDQNIQKIEEKPEDELPEKSDEQKDEPQEKPETASRTGQDK